MTNNEDYKAKLEKLPQEVKEFIEQRDAEFEKLLEEIKKKMDANKSAMLISMF